MFGFWFKSHRVEDRDRCPPWLNCVSVHLAGDVLIVLFSIFTVGDTQNNCLTSIKIHINKICWCKKEINPAGMNNSSPCLPDSENKTLWFNVHLVTMLLNYAPILIAKNRFDAMRTTAKLVEKRLIQVVSL